MYLQFRDYLGIKWKFIGEKRGISKTIKMTFGHLTSHYMEFYVVIITVQSPHMIVHHWQKTPHFNEDCSHMGWIPIFILYCSPSDDVSICYMLSSIYNDSTSDVLDKSDWMVSKWCKKFDRMSVLPALSHSLNWNWKFYPVIVLWRMGLPYHVFDEVHLSW